MTIAKAIEELERWVNARQPTTDWPRGGAAMLLDLVAALRAQGEPTRAVPEGYVLVPEMSVAIAIERPEGYEDVHPQLVAEDAMHGSTFGWSLLAAAKEGSNGKE